MLEILLVLVAPGALVGLVAGLVARQGLAAVLERILVGSIGGGLLAYFLVTQLDFSDGDARQTYMIWAIFSAVGALLVLGLYRLVRGRSRTA